MTTKTKAKNADEVARAVRAIAGTPEPMQTLHDVQREVGRMIRSTGKIAAFMEAIAGE